MMNFSSRFKILLGFLFIFLMFSVFSCEKNENELTPGEIINSNGELEPNLNKCECGVFLYNESLTVQEGEEPIVTVKPSDVICPLDEDDICIKQCLVYRKEIGEQGIVFLCAEVGEYEDLVVSFFARACGGPWKYTDLNNAEYPICCAEGQLVICSKGTFEENLNDIITC